MSTTLADTPSRTGRSIGPDRLEVHLYAGTAQVIDVREPEVRARQGWIASSVNIPARLLDETDHARSTLLETVLDPTRTTVVHCADGSRSSAVVDVLMSLDWHDVVELDGGIRAWTERGRPVVGLAHWQI